MSAVTKSVDQLVDANPDVDNQEVFDQLWAITTELFEKVRDRFDLTMDPCCENLQPYSGAGNAKGYLAAYAGPEIDWLIHSHVGNPKSSFTNMHLTISLGAHIDAPHFGFALGTIPDIFWYVDALPRREMILDPEYVDRYWYGEANDDFFSLIGKEGFSTFVSQDVYTRVALSPTAVCYSVEPGAESIQTIRMVGFKALDRWLSWVDEAGPVPEEGRAALAERDEFIRRTICERDPANIVAEKLFGKELTDHLVATLWGGSRTLKRAT